MKKKLLFLKKVLLSSLSFIMASANFLGILPSAAYSQDVDLLQPNGLHVTKSVSKTNVYRNLPEDRLVEYEITVENTESCEDAPIDMMLVLDRSGSMDDDSPTDHCLEDPSLGWWDCWIAGYTWVNEPQPITDTKEAAKGFVDLFDTSLDQIGLVSYADSASMDHLLSNDFNSVKTAIDSIFANGWTNLGQAISLATTELLGNGRPQAVPVMVVLTDGRANVNEMGGGGDVTGGEAYAEAMATLAKTAGIRVITIGLGSNVNEAWLRDVIATSSSDYYFSPDSSSLATIYESIQATLGDSLETILTDDISSILDHSDFLSADNGGVFDPATETITWDLDTLLCNADGGIDSTRTVHFSVVVHDDVEEGTILSNYASVTNLGGSYAESNLVSTAVHVLEKTDDIDPVYPGQMITYTIEWATGDYDVEDLIIVDNLDTRVDYHTSVPSGSYDGGLHQVTWHLGPQLAHTTGEVYLMVDVPIPWIDGTLINNFAEETLVYPQPLELPYPTTGTPCEVILLLEDTGVLPYVDLVIDKSESADPVQLGDTFTYVITYENVGNSTSHNTEIVESLPSEVSYVAGSSEIDDVSVADPTGTNPYTWSIGNLEADGSHVLTFEVMVNSVKSIDNMVCINSDEDKNCTTETTEVLDVRIDKRGSINPVEAGDELTYTIMFENTGSTTIHNVSLSDTLPDGVSYISGSTSLDSVLYADPTGTNPIAWDIGELLTDGPHYLTFRVNVSSPLPDGFDLHNDSCIVGDDLDQECDYEDTEVNSAPIFEIEKSDDIDPIMTGEILTYTISFENIGTDISEATVIEDTLPAGLYYVAGSTKIDGVPADDPMGSNPYSWEVGLVSSGEVHTLTFSVTVGYELSDEQIVTNSTTIEGFYIDQDGAYLSVDDSATEDTLIYAPNLEIEKVDEPSVIIPGENITYYIEYRNTGHGDASNVIIEESYSDDVTFVSSNPIADDINNTLWMIGDLPAGGSGSIEIVVLAEPEVPLEYCSYYIDNLIEIYENVLDGKYDSDKESTEVDCFVDITFDKTDDVDPVESGGVLTYSLTYTNNGSINAENVVITEIYDSNVTFVSSTPSPDLGFDNQWTIGSLAPGESDEILITVNVVKGLSDGALLLNSAEICYEDPTGENGDYCIPSDEETEVNSAPVLNVIKTDTPDPVVVGQVLSYSVTIENVGNMEASSVEIVDTLPTGLSYVSGSSLFDGASISDPTGTNPYTWSIGTLALDGTHTLTFNVLVDATLANGTIKTNSVTLNGSYIDNTETIIYVSDTDTEDTTAIAPVLGLTKTNDAPSAGVNPGGTVTFTIVVTNTGSSTATGVTITDTLPAGVTYTAGSSTLNGVSVGDPTVSGSNLVWNVGTISANGGYVTLVYKVGVNATATAGAYSNLSFSSAVNDPTQSLDDLVTPSVTSTFTVVIGGVLGEETGPGQILGATGSIALIGLVFGMMFIGTSIVIVKKYK